MAKDNAVERLIDETPKGILVLRFGTIARELSEFISTVERRLTPESVILLKSLRAQIEEFTSAKPGQLLRWQTPPGRNIETLSSDGAHQPQRHGHGHKLFGAVGFVWELEPLGQKSHLHRPFRLRNSSVSVSLKSTSPEQPTELVAWDFDVGDDHSPGCHFHAKFSAGRGATQPDVVDVPRLPSLLFMPTDAIEFVLGELWQDEWKKECSSSAVRQWKRHPAARVERLLDWYREEAQSGGTPWTGLKHAKPRPRLFLEDDR